MQVDRKCVEVLQEDSYVDVGCEGRIWNETLTSFTLKCYRTCDFRRGKFKVLIYGRVYSYKNQLWKLFSTEGEHYIEGFY